MLILEMRFPGGRYHATPWDHHVNEGLVEWPPSPWRLCRALLSVWHRHGRPTDEPVLARVIDTLSRPPLYHVPPITSAHTRHYMPRVKENPAKIFDTFHVIDRNDILRMIWPDADLSIEDHRWMEELLNHLTYLGRSESWVQAWLATDGPPNDANVQPIGCWDHPEKTVPLRILHPQTEAAYTTWRSEFLSANPSKRKAVPSSVMEALNQGTDLLKKHKWNRFPGSCWISYGACFPEPAPIHLESSKPRAVNVGIYELSSNVRPRIENTLYIGERFRVAMMSRSRDENDTIPAVISGKDSDGRHLTDDHQHAYYLPVDLDGDGWIDHLVLWSPIALPYRCVEAAGGLAALWGSEGHTLNLGLQALTIQTDFPDHPITGKHRVWNSFTPYFRSRHPKFYRRKDAIGRRVPKTRDNGRQIDGLEDLLLHELAQRGYPEPDVTELEPVIPLANRHRTIPWYRFASRRKKGKQRPDLPGSVLRVEFPEPVWGPIAAGYGAHFGLGLFKGGSD